MDMLIAEAPKMMPTRKNLVQLKNNMEITVAGTKSDDYPGPGSAFGNVMRGNEVLKSRNYALNQYWPIWQGQAFGPDNWTAIGVSGSYNVIEGNYLCDGGVGVTIRSGGEANVVRDNRIDRVRTHVLDGGTGTVVIPPSYQPYEATPAGGERP